MHLTKRSDDVSEKVPGKSNCMPKSVTKHYHLSSYCVSSIFLEGWGFFSFSFLRKNFIGHTLLGGKETKLFGIKASCGSLPTEENCFGHRFVLTIP